MYTEPHLLEKQNSVSNAETTCIHCGNPVPVSRQNSQESARFCCRGCETVYGLLHSRGLGTYYDLKKSGRSIRKSVTPRVEEVDARTYDYLDDPEFLKLYRCNTDTMRFYLEGVHCAACVWLTEKVADFVDDVSSIRLDLASSVATVTLAPGGSFGPVAEEFSRVGYTPHPVKQDEAIALQKREERLTLVRLAVAGACTGNIMLLAISLYGGLVGPMAETFRWVSFVLFLPVFFFSAIPFYQTAWASIRTRRMSIDIPIVLGIVLGAIMSLVNLFTGSEHIYFDSLSALVFLLLASRYVLKRAQQNALNTSNLMHFLTPSLARKEVSEGRFAEVSLDRILVGDRVEVRAGECIPVDGVVETGTSTLNCALLTGESRLLNIGVGQAVFAGTFNQQAPLLVRVTQSGGATRLGQILRSMEENLQRRAPIVAFADRLSKHFVTVVVAIVGLVFVWSLRTNWHEAMNRALALAIVTCPCAFALATPLAMISSIARCAKAGILVKGGDVLEKLSKIKTVFLDKTGTLTTGTFEVLKWQIQPEFQAEAEFAISALESHSNHPVARALLRYLEDQGKVIPSISTSADVADFNETIGQGVQGTVRGHRYEIGRFQAGDFLSHAFLPHSSQVRVIRDGKPIGEISLGDRLRDDSIAAVRSLIDTGVNVRILSGDSSAAVSHITSQVGLAESAWDAEKTPEEKSQIVEQTPDSLMVGDGANDAVALVSASVGVAAHSGMEVAMRAADSYLFSPGVLPVYRLIIISRETMKIIYRNFAFSVLYNLVGGVAAIIGKINPLWAAILMPLSAFTVLLSSLAGTSRLRYLTRGE